MHADSDDERYSTHICHGGLLSGASFPTETLTHSWGSASVWGSATTSLVR